ncbi:MAG: lytic murein transglycosylase [Methylococcales bacterium]
MKKAHYKHIVKLTVAVFLVGCASESETYRSAQPIKVVPQNPVVRQQVIPPPQPQVQSQPRYNNYRNSQSYNYSSSGVSGTYADYPEVRSFIRHMVQKHGFSESYLNGLFSQARRLDSVIRLESPAPSTGPSKPRLGSWTRYRDKFLTDAHISNGVEFWRNNADAIQKASATYGVDPEYIVGIIGVETYFGKNIGKTCIFDALTTLAFDTERRGKYFASELENFLLMTKEEGFEPRQPVGSWAGAMGLGQFMPSSFRKLAVDFDRNGRRDLWHPKDAIGSVAHYFSKSGWQFNNPVTKLAAATNDESVIELSTYDGNEYWRVFPNFKVIKKYNNSSKYAMAVHQLAQAIKQRYY